jgi:predicted PurR-regulated permease PerM
MSTRLQKASPDTPPAAPRPAVRADVQSVALTGLFVLACLAALVAAREFFIPVTFSLMLYFLLMPAVRALKQAGIAEAAGAAILVVALVALLALGVYVLSWPAADWLEKAPRSLARMQARLNRMLGPLAPVAVVGPPGPAANAAAAQGLGTQVLGRLRHFLDQLVVVAALLYFLLASGDRFLRALVRVLPNLRDKVRAVAIAREMERQISRYLVAFTINNLILGVVTGAAMAALGMPSPLLWGAVAFATNYVIILGGLVTTVALAMAALVTFDDPTRALMVPAAFLVINVLESNVLYTLIVGRRVALNPVVVFAGVTFWLWAWGIVGALLAVPMLAALKIFAEHIEGLKPLAEFLADQPEEDNGLSTQRTPRDAENAEAK